jgi:hypothetical protein
LRVRFDCPGVAHTAEECHGRCCVNCDCPLCRGKCLFLEREETCCVHARGGTCTLAGAPQAGQACRVKGWPPGNCAYFDSACAG